MEIIGQETIGSKYSFQIRTQWACNLFDSVGLIYFLRLNINGNAPKNLK